MLHACKKGDDPIPPHSRSESRHIQSETEKAEQAKSHQSKEDVKNEAEEHLHDQLNKLKEVTRENAKPATKIKVVDISEAIALQINRTAQNNLLEIQSEGLTLSSVEEAFEYLNVNVSMATPPAICAKDDLYFYFSGGTSVQVINDFSRGMRVSAQGGEISSWNFDE